MATISVTQTRKTFSYKTGIIWQVRRIDGAEYIQPHRWLLEKVQPQILHAAASAQYWIENCLQEQYFPPSEAVNSLKLLC